MLRSPHCDISCAQETPQQRQSLTIGNCKFHIITHDGRISNTWQNLDKHAVTRKPIDDGPSTSPHHSTLIICQPTTQNVATNG